MISISPGNTKLGKISSASHPCARWTDGRTCKGCYALRFFRVYQAVRDAYQRNARLIEHNRAEYFQSISEHVGGKTYFRWHVAGDIVDQDYFDRMNEVAVENPGTLFCVFTKEHHLDFTQRQPNLIVRLSVWPGLKRPAKRIARAWRGGMSGIPKGTFVCPGDCRDCKFCWESTKSVVFPVH